MGDTIRGRLMPAAAIQRFLVDVRSGPSALIFEGEEGIGKTTMWIEGLAEARRITSNVLVCRPERSEAQRSFNGLSELLEDVLTDLLLQLPAAQARALVAACLRLEVGEWRSHPGAISFGFLGILRLLCASKPCIIAIDDIEWLDSASMRVLEFAFRRIRDEHAGLLCSRRGGNSAHAFARRFLPSMAHQRIQRMELGPLARGEMDRLLQTRFWPPFPRSIRNRIHRASQGNPLFALLIGRELRRTGIVEEVSEELPAPERLRRLVDRRYTDLSRSAREMLRVASAISKPSADVVEATLGDHDRTLDGLRECIEAGIIELQDGRIRFSHPIFSAMIQTDIGPRERRRLHRRLAGLVPDLEERARHLSLSTVGPDHEVAASLEQGARAARARGSPEAAAELIEQARRLTPLDRLDEARRRTIAAAGYHFEAGATSRARVLLEQMSLGDPSRDARIEALWLLGRIGWYEDSETALKLFQQAFKEAGHDASLIPLLASINMDLGWTYLLSGQLPRAAAHLTVALELAEAVGEPVALAEALTAYTFAEALLARGTGIESMQWADELDTGTTEPLRIIGRPRTMLGVLLKWADRLPDARRVLLTVRKEASDRGDETSLPFILYHLSELETWAGDLHRAKAYAEEAFELSTATGQDPLRAASLYALAIAKAHLGLVDESRAAAEHGIEAARGVTARLPMVQCVCVLGILESWQGHFLEADRYFNSVVDELQAMPLAIRFLPDAIESLIRLARLREAELLLDHFASTGKESKSWWALLATARCGALMRAASHDPVGAESLLRDSLHPLPSEAATIFPLEYARTLFVLGSVQRANRRYEPARTSLDQAHSIFENLGAVDWARKTGAELDRNAGRQAMPRKLTTTEERVAELTASGLTNQEIADVLFISVKTVEAHLTSIYRKVGVRSRVALAIWRGRRGATTSQAKD